MAVDADLLPCQHDCYLRRGQSRVLRSAGNVLIVNDAVQLSWIRKAFEMIAAVCRCKETVSKKGKVVQYEVLLADSPLYPEGGGQPSDRGQISVTSSDVTVGSSSCFSLCRKALLKS